MFVQFQHRQKSFFVCSYKFCPVLFCLVLSRVVCYLCMVLYGMVWYGMVWYGMWDTHYTTQHYYSVFAVLGREQVFLESGAPAPSQANFLPLSHALAAVLVDERYAATGRQTHLAGFAISLSLLSLFLLFKLTRSLINVVITMTK